jgi:hypothetical protein
MSPPFGINGLPGNNSFVPPNTHSFGCNIFISSRCNPTPAPFDKDIHDRLIAATGKLAGPLLGIEYLNNIPRLLGRVAEFNQRHPMDVPQKRTVSTVIEMAKNHYRLCNLPLQPLEDYGYLVIWRFLDEHVSLILVEPLVLFLD